MMEASEFMGTLTFLIHRTEEVSQRAAGPDYPSPFIRNRAEIIMKELLFLSSKFGYVYKNGMLVDPLGLVESSYGAPVLQEVPQPVPFPEQMPPGQVLFQTITQSPAGNWTVVAPPIEAPTHIPGPVWPTVTTTNA